jgi:hypothetical protein
VLDNLMDLECCFMGGYLLKSAEETVLWKSEQTS